MDGENNGKPYEQMDDLGVPTPIFGYVWKHPSKNWAAQLLHCLARPIQKPGQFGNQDEFVSWVGLKPGLVLKDRIMVLCYDSVQPMHEYVIIVLDH